MDTMITDMFERLLDDHISFELVRQIDAGLMPPGLSALLKVIEESEIMNVAIPEAAGGAGIDLKDMAPIFEALGRRGVMVPIAETILARALLAHNGQSVPSGLVAIGVGTAQGGRIYLDMLPGARMCDHLLFMVGERAALLPIDAFSASPQHDRYSQSARFELPEDAVQHWFAINSQFELLISLVHATRTAGILFALLESTLEYAKVRQQFGRNIGAFQIIQHMISQMTEETALASLSVTFVWREIALEQIGNELAVASACMVVGEAAVKVTEWAHAIHGAIGISAEHHLHLLTRQARELRFAIKSPDFWARRIGRAVLPMGTRSMIDTLVSVS